MERNFGLIKNEFGHYEKRVLPRFPFCYLIFKADDVDSKSVYEVKDISFTGMQLALKDGTHSFTDKSKITGTLHWHGQALNIEGTVMWVTPLRLGVAYKSTPEFVGRITDFLSAENIASSLKPIHDADMEIEFPLNLKYWLRADGPLEFFVWQHRDGEISKFQILLMEKFIEWQDGVGVKTGRVISKRDVDTPLMSEDEFVFQMSEEVGMDEVNFAIEVLDNVKESLMNAEIINFIRRKLHAKAN